MPKINFSDLDSCGKYAVFWLANEAETITPNVTNAASHPGEILEAVAFMKDYPKGSAPHAALASRLQLGGRGSESIMACIERAAPGYRSLADRADVEIDELMNDLTFTSAR